MGRIVDSYTNIQTIKAFSTGGHEDEYVAESVVDQLKADRVSLASIRDWAALHAEMAAAVRAEGWQTGADLSRRALRCGSHGSAALEAAAVRGAMDHCARRDQVG